MLKFATGFLNDGTTVPDELAPSPFENKAFADIFVDVFPYSFFVAKNSVEGVGDDLRDVIFCVLVITYGKPELFIDDLANRPCLNFGSNTAAPNRIPMFLQEPFVDKSEVADVDAHAVEPEDEVVRVLIIRHLCDLVCEFEGQYAIILPFEEIQEFPGILFVFFDGTSRPIAVYTLVKVFDELGSE